MPIYTTIGYEMLDEICYRIYGSELGTLEKVLAANPLLADMPFMLPEGVPVILPDLTQPSIKKEIKLWD